ncbi:ABC transporter ATP-binding protein [Bifidobacterium aemilianum]|uniref:ABC transporter ATP-binding protein n=1 Tax=Bifidobacterium aemilianum TaxID=2493120 RepID=A0A366K980_9BIFI|nr:ABC transporter ATP-binding protein [Bifidobacterium aemilianum]RBP98244.1 ABC transporter ATP-binding protein [Bifidobacterium aemilianum]
MSLSIKNLSVSIGGKTILDQVSLDLADGQRVGLVGPSGSGKSMITKAFLGLLPPRAQASGSICLGGKEILGASERTLADLRGAYVGTVFQNPAASLNPVLTVKKQLTLPLRLHYDLSRCEREERALAMLDKLGLDRSVANAYPSQLSGGQQQRVGIGTALITSPRLIIADEPTTALDSISQMMVIELLDRLVDQSGASLLFVTHDFSVLRRIASQAYVLDRGKVVEAGEIQRILTSPQSLEAQGLVAAARELTLAVGHGRQPLPAEERTS